MSKHRPSSPPPNTPPLDEIPVTGQSLAAEDSTEAMLSALHRRLGSVALDGETSLQALERILREHRDLAAQVQPAWDALGLKANTRGILVHHARESSPSYDTGGRFGVTLLTVEDGKVSLASVAEVGKDEQGTQTITPLMSYGTAQDHIDKALEDFLRPKAHRS